MGLWLPWDINVMQVNEDKFPALPGAPSPTPPSLPPAAAQRSGSSTNPKAARGYGLWGPPSPQQAANPSTAQRGSQSQQQSGWDQPDPEESGWGQEDVLDQIQNQVDSGWGQNHHQDGGWDQKAAPSQGQADPIESGWGQNHHQEGGWDQQPDPSQRQADPIESGWGQSHPLKDDRYLGKAEPASSAQHWEQKTNGSQHQQQSRGSGWDQSDTHAQGIWEQPQGHPDPWQNPQQGTRDHLNKGTWVQPSKQGSYNQPQQGIWGQPAQDPSSGLNQDGWDVPPEDPSLAPYAGRQGWDEGPVHAPHDDAPLNWQGLVEKGPSSAGQGSKQTDWDPRPEYRAAIHRYPDSEVIISIGWHCIIVLIGDAELVIIQGPCQICL